METFQQLASTIPTDFPEHPLPELSAKTEPDPSDLSELEDLLSDSLAQVAAKKPQTNRRIYKDMKQKVDGLIEAQNKVAWEVLENIEVWTRTKCGCGALGTTTFVRYMQKLKRVGARTLHWETVEELPNGEKRRFAMVTTAVQACGDCTKAEIFPLFEDFQEVTK